jgi:AcrR family transcriptional regulator
MPSKAQPFDFAVKKRPSQRRSQATFDAIVQACALVLVDRGYAGTTTNHIATRAGVNISSLYAYFPGKDAIIALVVERLVERVMTRLGEGAQRVTGARPDEAVRLWIHEIYRIVRRERELVRVLMHEVPYTNKLPAVRHLDTRLVAFSRRFREHAADFVDPHFSPATLHLVVNVVTSTLMQLVLDPPRDVSRDELLDELAHRIEGWIRAAT